MHSIENGLPEVTSKVGENKELDYMFTGEGENGIVEWTCKVCQVKNKWAQAHCYTCRTARPYYKLNADGTGMVADPNAKPYQEPPRYRRRGMMMRGQRGYGDGEESE